MIRRLKSILFNLIRPLFVSNIDPNEDFICGNCYEPVLKRDLYCSKKCADSDDFMQDSFNKYIAEEFEKTNGKKE